VLLIFDSRKEKSTVARYLRQAATNLNLETNNETSIQSRCDTRPLTQKVSWNEKSLLGLHDCLGCEDLRADFDHLDAGISDNRRVPATGDLINVPSPAQPLSSSEQAACLFPSWKPLGFQPAVELRRAKYFPAMTRAACAHGIPINLFDALIIQESGYNPLAHSIKGAAGLTQLMPGTAKSQGITNVWNIEQNLAGGALVLKAHLGEFGRYDLALAAYNAGPGRVRTRRMVPAIAETQGYVSSILARLHRDALQAERVALAAPHDERQPAFAF